MRGPFDPLPAPLELHIEWLGALWRVTLPAPGYYTHSSHARWEQMETLS